MSRLLNNLRTFPSSRRTAVVSNDMKLDIDWWLMFLPLYNGVSFIKPDSWSFEDLHFSTDSCLHGGGATCLDQCFFVPLPTNIVHEAEHITALELFVLVLAVRVWAPTLARRRFLISCDNEAAVTVINSGVTRDFYATLFASALVYSLFTRFRDSCILYSRRPQHLGGRSKQMAT